MDYYDIDGRPITMEQWLELFRDLPYRVVGATVIDEHTMVSTIWLGLDHSFMLFVPGQPIIFETMVFGAHDSLDQAVQLRYGTLQQAREGHADVVAMMRSLRAVEDPRNDVGAPQGPFPVHLRKMDRSRW